MSLKWNADELRILDKAIQYHQKGFAKCYEIRLIQSRTGRSKEAVRVKFNRRLKELNEASSN